MIKFELVTLAGTKFSESVYEVLLPTPEGEIAVFEHHMPLVSLATPGVIKVRSKADTKDSHLELFATNGGVIEIENNIVRVLVDEADHPDEINDQEVKKALDLAQKMKREAKTTVELSEAQSLIDRHLVALKVAELRRHRKPRNQQ